MTYVLKNFLSPHGTFSSIIVDGEQVDNFVLLKGESWLWCTTLPKCCVLGHTNGWTWTLCL